MWVFSQVGFFSIVTPSEGDCDVPGVLAVRSRFKKDIEAFMQMCPCVGGKPVHLKGRDYEWRAFAKASDVAGWMADEVLRVDYDNFKDRVAETQGHERAGTYGQIWGVLFNATHNLARVVGRVASRL